MTSKELLEACGCGKMPEVKYTGTLIFNAQNTGSVTTIKNNGKYLGCGVSFPGVPYEVWFWDSQESDRRVKYMRELILITENKQ